MSSSSPVPFSRRRRGNSVVETVLVLALVLLPLTFGAIEYSYAFYVKNIMQTAARETARRAILPACVTNLDAESKGREVLTQAFGSSRAGQFTFTFSRNVASATSGDEIRVTLTAPQWSVFGVRPLGSMPLYSYVAPAASKKFTAATVMYRE
ncbi:MAG: pilus assembly protein [Phycisphaerales bacterium]|nr:pilus assembly protein [Phycisphaerales bacterium]